jgi:alpha-ketoglutarate-dependent taurine dioxygenase/4-hydroxybenzoate polyprenyltransferase
MSVALESLSPFGLVVTADPGTTLRDLGDRIAAWVRDHKVVVLRNLEAPTKSDLPIAARELGDLQCWSFGSVHELRVEPSTDNYLYTDHAVPLHWDGAFAGAAPSYLVFHCVEAPSVGGETVFVDTATVWEKLSPEQKDRYRCVELRYTTEKRAHYGGRFEAPLVAQHELRGCTVLRFAEPVDDLNPVRVEVVGEGPIQGAHLLGEIRGELSAPDVRLVLPWRSGDVVVADNLGLLHGRNRFDGAEGRHIRRVNVLPPSRRTLRDTLLDSLRIRRPEFMVAELPILLIPLLLAEQSLPTFTLVSLVITFLLLFHVGDMTNCLADRDLDVVFKPKLAESVRRLGVPLVVAQIAVSALGALALTAEASYGSGDWAPLVLVALGLLLGLSYSLRPLYLKGRGLLQIPSLIALIFVGPMLLAWTMAGGRLDLWPLGIFVAYGSMQQGIILLNTAEDLPEDRAMNVYTSARALGLRGSIVGSIVLTAGGGTAVLGLLGAALSDAGRPIVLGLLPLSVTLLVFVTACVRVLRRLGSLAEDRAVRELRAASRLVPVWITATAVGALIGVGVLRC